MVLAVSAAAGQDGNATPIPTNEEVMADETARLLLELLYSDDSERPDEHAGVTQPIYLDMMVPVRVRSRMQSYLLSEGVRLAAEQPGYHSIRIQWEPDHMLLEQRGGTSQRTLRSDLYFSWLDADREIQKTWQSSFIWEDDIPTDQVPLVEGSWGPAAFHQKKESGRLSFIRRFGEPAIITGAIAVTIYLLYNVRS